MKFANAAIIVGVLALPGIASAHDAATCDRLKQVTIPAGDIGMPTHGATVTAVQWVDKDARGPLAGGAYCLVSGAIAPLDPKSTEIRFQIALPATWNHKAVMLGGGGFDGTIPSVTQSPNNFDPRALSPLARGYAVFADDGGHRDPGIVDPGAFLLDAEAYHNWMGDALKKTRDAAMILIKANYGGVAAKAFFIGGSSGGREGLLVAARWPSEWDGVVALYPARNSIMLTLGQMAANRGFAQPGAWSNPAKRQVLYRAALAACDTLDGVADGVISDVKRCEAEFHPQTALLDGRPVRCPAGADTGDTCLSDAQLAALERVNAPIRFTYPLAQGEQEFPGYNVYASDSGQANSPARPFVSMMSFGDAPPAHPYSPGMSFASGYIDNFVRFGIARDPQFAPLTLDPEHPGQYAARIRELGGIEAIGSIDRFAAHGGKLLIMHGTGDLLVSPRLTEAYYAQLVRTMGAQRVSAFVRFYEVPAFGHGISDVFNASWDYLTALENWSERGMDPAQNETVTDTVGVPGRTRPLCLYPSWPKYRGAGDPNNSGSFSCSEK